VLLVRRARPRSRLFPYTTLFRSRRSRADVASRIARRRREVVGRVGQRTGRIGPGPASVGGGSAQQRRAVIDTDGGAGSGRPGQEQRVVVVGAIASDSALVPASAC